MNDSFRVTQDCIGDANFNVEIVNDDWHWFAMKTETGFKVYKFYKEPEDTITFDGEMLYDVGTCAKDGLVTIGDRTIVVFTYPNKDGTFFTEWTIMPNSKRVTGTIKFHHWRYGTSVYDAI